MGCDYNWLDSMVNVLIDKYPDQNQNEFHHQYSNVWNYETVHEVHLQMSILKGKNKMLHHFHTKKDFDFEYGVQWI